jgi:hypothetical protein
MTCRDLEGLIIPYASGTAIPPEAGAHIAGCRHCLHLVRAMSAIPQTGLPAPDRLERIEAAICVDLKPVKPLPRTSVLSLPLIITVGTVAAIGAAVLGIAGWRALSVFQATVVFTALPLAALLLAFSVVRQIAPGSKLTFSPRVLVAAVLASSAGIAAIIFYPRPEPAFVPTGLVCLRIGLECAIPAGLAFWLVLRRGAILDPQSAGATAGTLAGVSGLAVLELFCPNLNVFHILAWHLGAVLTSTIGGFIIGTVADGVRRSRAGLR